MLEVDDMIRDIIHEGSTTDLRHYLHEIHFMSFRKAAIEKVLMGITTVEEVSRVLPHSALRSPRTIRSQRLKSTLRWPIESASQGTIAPPLSAES